MEENTSGMPGPAAGPDVREQVSLPAILLMVTGGIGIALALLGMVQGLTGANSAQLEQLMSNPDIPPWLKSMASTTSSPVASILSNLFSMAINGLVIFGGLKMKNLESRGLAMAASIIALIPCFACYCLGIPVGIWSLVVLSKPEVKAAFRA
jgi:hypothetical protein